MKKIYNFFSKKFVLGFSIIMIFYLTIGFIASYIVLNAIANQTHNTASMFGTWWQILIFVFDLIFMIMLAFSILSIIKNRKIRGVLENEKGKN